MAAEVDYMSDEFFEQGYDIENPIYRENYFRVGREAAAKQHKAKVFDQKRAAYEKALKQQKAEAARREREAKKANLTAVRMTEFSDIPEPYQNMECGTWFADDGGVKTLTEGGQIIFACPHPILPVERLKNIQDGFEQIKIIYKRDGGWTEKIFLKDVTSSASKIVALSNFGIIVTTESSKFLVRYLSDVEAHNGRRIPIRHSSSKFGWIEKDFLPYDKEIIFDGELQFAQLSASLKPRGELDAWLEEIKTVRASSGSEQVRFMIAASFSSVLLPLLELLPFFVDLWGDTEGGKTVLLMICSSIWADPAESRYMGDFKTTQVALEVKANVLNNLPMILDDTSKISQQIKNNFESFVYDMASGKGKSRSDKTLGVRHENSWCLATLTSGEAPLTSYVNQAGAMNRVLEVHAEEKLFSNPQHIVEVIKRNYGHAGPLFVRAVKNMGEDAIKKVFDEVHEKLRRVAGDRMQKQLFSMAAVLVADKLAADCIFNDGIYLDIEKCLEFLADPEEISIHERAYKEICDKVRMNASKFATNDEIPKTELWGMMGAGNLVYIYPQALNELCVSGGYSKKAFLDWAAKHGKIEKDQEGNTTKVRKDQNGRPARFIWLRLNDVEPEKLADGFERAEKNPFV